MVQELKNSFRFTEERFENHKQLSKNISNTLFSLFYYITFFLKKIGFLKILVWFGKRNIEQRVHVRSNIYHVVLTENQYKTASILKENGLEYPLIGLGYSNIKLDYSFSKLDLVFYAFIDWERFRSIFKGCNNYDILAKNNIRLLILVGIANLIEYFRDAKIIIKYNDHGPHSTFLYDQLERLNIKTVFVQHASTGKYMPKTLYHDINYLFSRKSEDHYEVVNPDSISIVGCDLRIKKLIDDSRKFSNEGAILLATNDFDDATKVTKCAKLLRDKFPHQKVIYRPHPRQGTNGLNEIVDEVSREDLAYDLSRSEVVLANESGIALEAMALDKLFYKCSFFSEHIDNYGFFESGLIKKNFFSLSELIASLSKQELSYDKYKLEYFVGDFDRFRNSIKELKSEIEHRS